MLEGDVHVGHGVRRKGLQKPVIDAVRLQVEEAQPVRGGLERRQLAEQAAHPAPPGLRPPRRVLADEHQLARAGGHGRACRAQHFRRLYGLVVALDQRDGAERAAPVAAVGDLDVGADGALPARDGHRCGRPPFVCGLSPGLRQRRQQRRHVEAAPQVHLGDLGGELLAVALHEAAHGRDAATVRVRGLRGVEHGLDRLLFGRIDEAAGVDDDDVGAGGRRRAVPRGAQPRLERVGVGLVLGTAERLDEERAARGGPQR